MTSPHELDQHVRSSIATMTVARPTTLPAAGIKAGSALTGQLALSLFEAQATSRHLDLVARRLRADNEGFYTIGSAGHEGNAAVAAALRHDDPALLHYRSGAFYCARAAQLPGSEPIRDVLRGLVASAWEPIAGGRHKVIGHARHHVIPTTSTIASHLPRAVGLAMAIERSRRIGGTSPWAPDAVVVASFGDASINHASAASAFNTAGWCAHAGLPLPLLLICEDNGLGISVRSPTGWVAAALSSRPGIRYLTADGGDVAQTFDVAREAVAWVRRGRRPAVLHLKTVRLMGHAGADAELAYRTAEQLAADLAADPLLGTARLLVSAGVASPSELLGRYDQIGEQVRAVAAEVTGEPKLSDVDAVLATLAPRDPSAVAGEVEQAASAVQAVQPPPTAHAARTVQAPPAAQALRGGKAARDRAFAGRLPEHSGGLTLAQGINAALTDAMVADPGVLVFGEDVAVKGGVYGVTKGLRDRFGAARVFDTLLDETSILGLALGAGLAGLLPVPEIQYLAYLHNAEDQLRGEAATMQFFSSGAYRNPMVVRIAGLAYQQGFGGHFHNDNALAVLRDIPGLVLAVPARADDAAAMLRTCLASARTDGSVCAFVEPIALYHTRDLHTDGDGQWLAPYAAPDRWSSAHAPIGRARGYGEGGDLTIVTFGNGVRMSLRAAARLRAHGADARVLDLRWLAPLPVDDIVRECTATGRVLIVDETRRQGGISEAVAAALLDARFAGAARRLTAVDSFIPLGPAARHVLVTEDMIVDAAQQLCAAPTRSYSTGRRSE